MPLAHSCGHVRHNSIQSHKGEPPHATANHHSPSGQGRLVLFGCSFSPQPNVSVKGTLSKLLASATPRGRPLPVALGFSFMRCIAYAGFFLLHAFASLAAFLWHYTVSASRFDGRAVSPLSLHLSAAAEKVLWFPLVEPLFELLRPAGWLGWLPVLLNSALWVSALALLMRWLRRRHLARSSTVGSIK